MPAGFTMDATAMPLSADNRTHHTGFRDRQFEVPQRNGWAVMRNPTRSGEQRGNISIQQFKGRRDL